MGSIINVGGFDVRMAREASPFILSEPLGYAAKAQTRLAKSAVSLAVTHVEARETAIKADGKAAEKWEAQEKAGSDEEKGQLGSEFLIYRAVSADARKDAHKAQEKAVISFRKAVALDDLRTTDDFARFSDSLTETERNELAACESAMYDAEDPRLKLKDRDSLRASAFARFKKFRKDVIDRISKGAEPKAE